MIALNDAWVMVQREGKGGYCMAPHMEYYRQTHHLSVKGLMKALATSETGLICLARCGNPSPNQPGYFAKLEELCGIYGADVDMLEKILRYEEESANTPANGGNDDLE